MPPDKPPSPPETYREGAVNTSHYWQAAHMMFSFAGSLFFHFSSLTTFTAPEHLFHSALRPEVLPTVIQWTVDSEWSVSKLAHHLG